MRFASCVTLGLALGCGGSGDASPSDAAAPDVTNSDAKDDAREAIDAIDADATTADGLADAPIDAPDWSAIDAKAAALVAEMTLAEKAGQMTLVDYEALAGDDDVSTLALGGLLASGNDAPGGNTPADWLALTTRMRAEAAKSRLAIPILFGVDAVHGNAKVKGATVFPHDIGFGCANDADLVRRAESVAASEVLALGIDWTFSPDADVSLDERWGRTYESFSEDTTLVSNMVSAAVGGYQNAGLLACAKHALGAGGTSWGTGVDGGIDQGDAEIDEATMRAVHLPPFAAAIDAGALSIMVSYSSWNGTKMSASAKWLTDVIKGELGFRGFLVSDYAALGQLPGTPREQAATAINAGIDMVMLPSGHRALIDDIQALVSAGTVPQARVDDAVTRILRAKIAMGLFEAKTPSASGLSVVGSAANRAVAREAVSKSLVLLKNDGGLLPLSKSTRVHVAGRAASDLGIQCGGWTLGWQGSAGVDATALGGGETILDAMRAAVSSDGGEVTYSADGTGASGASVGVVVLGELPYAEYFGDTSDPSFSNASSPTIYDGTAASVVANMVAAKIPLVLVLVTGRPIRLESMLPSFSAVVAAWLPGSEGGGVSDALFGDARFTAKLSHSWPKDSTTLPIHRGLSPYDPLFPFGFGLSD